MTDTAKKIEELEAALAELKKSAAPAPAAEPAGEPIKLDFGCGKNKKPGFKGVDVRPWEGVDIVLDIANSHWPWPDHSVDEAHASHMIEHLTWPQRIHFFNELGRILKKGAKATITWPSPFSDRYYGDPTHQAPMSAFACYYLNREWRAGNKDKNLPANAPHVDFDSNTDHFWHEYTCDFDFQISQSLHPALAGRNQEYISEALLWWKEAAQDIQATLTQRKG